MITSSINNEYNYSIENKYRERKWEWFV